MHGIYINLLTCTCRFQLCLLETSPIWKMKELLEENRDKTSQDNGETRKPKHCVYLREWVHYARTPHANVMIDIQVDVCSSANACVRGTSL